MADADPATLILSTQPTPTEQQQVIALLQRSAAVDGHSAVNDAGMLALRHTDPDETRAPLHAIARDRRAEAVIGYAQAVWEAPGPVAALVVDPDHRRRGIGTALWRVLAEQVPAPLRVWASGNSEAAQRLAARVGLHPVRTLLILGRPLTGPLPPTDTPPGIALRTFGPGDEDSWVAVNARAFADHPEQGAMTGADLAQRMAEPWFDPDGFFLAVRTDPVSARDELVGFHWTKRQPGAATGEVYVIGVDPTAGVRGLGTPLLGAGLRHLRDQGATTVDLYVEADNERALALYRRHGFTQLSANVMYAATDAPAVPPEATG